VLDTVGCAFGGYDSEPARIARDLAAEVSCARPATVLCSNQKTTPELARFANDVMMRYLDFNDGYIASGSGHPSDSIAALLAAGEVARADGRELITATVLAYEVFCRICDAWDNKKSGIDHATMGAIASAAGAARLAGPGPRRDHRGDQPDRCRQRRAEPDAHRQHLEMEGVAVCQCEPQCPVRRRARRARYDRAAPVFEGRDGFFKVVSKGPFELAPFGGAGRPFRIMQVPREAVSARQLLADVVTAGPRGAQARRRRARHPGSPRAHLAERPEHYGDGPEKWRPMNRENGRSQHSYTAGVALKYGTVELKVFR
jgi:2-methylcitrate dehydratase